VQILFSDKLKPILYSLIMAVILFIALAKGMSDGKKSAQSQAIINSVASLQKGVSYFNNDQNRFPTAVEFSDQVIMSDYFGNFPPVNFAATSCAENYIYKRVSDSNYELDFCLPVNAGAYKAGWNSISQSK